MKTGTRVKAYRNLNKPSFFSVKSEGKVIGYSQFLMLSEVTFTGGHSKAQADIQNGAHRSVHAYACGVLQQIDGEASHESLLTDGFIEVTYTPKIRAGFYIKSSGIEVTEADYCILTNNKMYCINPR